MQHFLQDHGFVVEVAPTAPASKVLEEKTPLLKDGQQDEAIATYTEVTPTRKDPQEEIPRISTPIQEAPQQPAPFVDVKLESPPRPSPYQETSVDPKGSVNDDQHPLIESTKKGCCTRACPQLRRSQFMGVKKGK